RTCYMLSFPTLGFFWLTQLTCNRLDTAGAPRRNRLSLTFISALIKQELCGWKLVKLDIAYFNKPETLYASAIRL
ncbi:MAG: hypothetical protein ABIV42_05770, partial [Nitrosospira sp.]